MKVIKDFVPLTIEIESKDEWNQLLDVLSQVYNERNFIPSGNWLNFHATRFNINQIELAKKLYTLIK